MGKSGDDGQQEETVHMDTNLRFVRVRGERPNGMVEFDFAIGDPEISVELILSRVAFDEFCATNKVIFLEDPEKEPGSMPSDWDWSLADATQIRFK